MAKKQFFAVVDTETTIDSTVADFAICIVDRKGKIYNQIAVLVAGEYGVKELFHDANSSAAIWTLAGLAKRHAIYDAAIKSGSRMLASVNAINRWIDLAIQKYDPTLTAYNLPFDLDKCLKTGIDLSGFSDRFCLWQAALGNICDTKGYKKFILDHHLFNNRTKFGNLTFSTNAENVSHFITGNDLIEPHTALEDVTDHEIPILLAIIKKRKWREKCRSYNWRAHQARDHYTVK